MTIESRVSGVPDRAYNNALKAKLRDPSRSINLIRFMTLRERQILYFTSFHDKAYESWFDAGDNNV